ncbi:MAG: ribonuclease Y [Planctomycetales bacterium]|nr:ribonuclease Y [Planctomycetales bacterium]
MFLPALQLPALPYPLLAEGELGSILIATIGLVLGGGAILLVNYLRGRDAKTQAKAILEQAQADATNTRRAAELEAKESALQQKQVLESESNKLRESIRKKESALDRREETLQQSADDLRKQEKMVETNQRRLAERIQEASKRSEELKSIVQQQTQQLQSISGLSREEASQRLLKLLEDELEKDIGNQILKHERRVTEIAEQKAQEIILTAMQRYAAAHTADSTTSTVDIPNDDMKGRIIGREGRNIRAFEKATGVDVIIDDTPGVVIVSGFDPVRREVARLSLDKLISDGRIHPSRIEEIVTETNTEIEKYIRRKGQEAAEEVNISGLHERVIYMLGRLHFRTSFSQNVLRHSVEVAFLSGLMAEMTGLNPDLARRAGLLHDIGKAADHELEGGHPKIGADLLKRHGEKEIVVHAALGHHDQLTTDYPYTLLVATADACSASRPGARRESLERYIKRMEELESIAKSFSSVEQAFAIQAGRELRVIVSAKDTDDAVAAKICRDIARAFEQQLTYPGEIKVTVVRESRFTDVAR